MALQKSELQVIKNYASGYGKLTPDNEPDLIFFDENNKTIALCEVKTPDTINKEVFNVQLKKFALRCERENACFYLCTPAQSLGAALAFISETKIFEKLIERKLFKLFTFSATPEELEGKIEEVQL